MSESLDRQPALAYPTSQLRMHRFVGLEPGPRLIVLGAVHGNEVAGARGIERVVAEMDSGALPLVRGSVTFVPVTNPLAYQKVQRNGDRNLNRNLRPTDTPQDFEDRIANVLCPLLAGHEVLLDLHTFQAASEPFAMLGPADNTGDLEPFTHALAEQALALRLGVRRVVEGWLSTYALGVQQRLARTPPQSRAGLLSTDPSYGVGTTEYMRSQGGYAITLECGQHADPAAPEVAYRAIRNTLAHLGLVDAPAPPACQNLELLRLAQVVDRYHPDDAFIRPWSSFDPISAGQQVATRHDGTPVLASMDGYIVFPNANATPGNEWFYLAQPSVRDMSAGLPVT
ncbi:succinylglutamate desuccinylase/aspartoacylase family protein [Rhodoferax sp.]|uniref:succinylglutamate desuccinylase/aspartoacylase domain-containing protein n=1 Tax=Rhodoferax sp. TaxID=50421 RepID=UPI002851601B|nr:succinylglutamate desuccinylase/aspartoacylase family protein [Rhodoferax sp.]MDR3368557.1 succinylglutamate desuccinylase/aspartoacylase family protein [Rhodoferax sp.]